MFLNAYYLNYGKKFETQCEIDIIGFQTHTAINEEKELVRLLTLTILQHSEYGLDIFQIICDVIAKIQKSGTTSPIAIIPTKYAVFASITP